MGSDVNEVLQQAMEFYVAGHTVEAKALLLDLVRAHPALEAGWMFLSYTLDDPKQKADCLRQVLKLNPQNTEAKGSLDQLLPTPSAEPKPAASAHSSPFTVDISHANDNVVAGAEATPALTWESKMVSAFPETTEVRKPAQPAAAKPPPPITREAPPIAIKSETPVVADAPAAAIETPPVEMEELSPVGDVTAAAKKPAPASGKPTAVGAAGESAKPKKRRNTGCTCLVIVIVALLVVAAAGAVLLWKGGYLSGFFTTVQPTGIDTPVPSITDTPVLLTLPPRWTDTPSPTETFTPTQTPTASLSPTPTPSETMASPDATQAAELVKLEKQVAGLRGLHLDEAPPIYIVSTDQAESIMQSMVDQSNFSTTIGNTAKVLVALGLLDPAYDLAKYSRFNLALGRPGFFNYFDHSIYMVGYRFSGMDRFVFAHEYGHALVYHYFPEIKNGYTNPLCISQDCESIQAITEGDAGLVESEWYNTYATAADKSDISKYQIPFTSQTGINPPVFGEPLNEFIGTEGEKFLFELWKKGDWAEVNKVYAKLPISTEQILHPDKYFKAEMPTVMKVPDLLPGLGTAWTLVGSDSLGEFLTYLVLAYGTDAAAHIPINDALTATAGWGGDHYLVYAASTGDSKVLAAEWNWDTDKDATEFLASMKTYLDKRFQSAKVAQPGSDCWSKNNQTTCVYYTYKNTLWILGPDMGTVQSVLASYPAYS
jgi:hypothetical protein